MFFQASVCEALGEVGTGHTGKQGGLSPFSLGMYRQVDTQLQCMLICTLIGEVHCYPPVPLFEKMDGDSIG